MRRLQVIYVHAESEKAVYTGEKITTISGEGASQDSKPGEMDGNGMPNHWAIPIFPLLGFGYPLTSIKK